MPYLLNQPQDAKALKTSRNTAHNITFINKCVDKPTHNKFEFYEGLIWLLWRTKDEREKPIKVSILQIEEITN